MDTAVNFTIRLTEGVSRPWPIAVYLFLAGISGGAAAVAIMLKSYRKQADKNTPILKAATLPGAVTILFGMVCLVADLTSPLFSAHSGLLQPDIRDEPGCDGAFGLRSGGVSARSVLR